MKTVFGNKIISNLGIPPLLSSGVFYFYSTNPTPIHGQVVQELSRDIEHIPPIELHRATLNARIGDDL